jgi:type IV pilus assembly protein PilM
MADAQAAWGIEIGQAGLKAIKLRYAEAANQVVAVAFDYVPHPKLLSQPDAVPDELIKQALDTFLSRNPIGSDLVAISLPGQTALAKFIQLPPVESARVKEIVKYEARQQIPFALEEVIWDFQTLGGGIEESGFILDGEVGLFAMKREQVQHHLQPFLDKKVEVELVQIAPLGLYNFLCYDRLGIRLNTPREEIDEYSVVVDMGCDNTTLMVTNGKKIWIRNMPVGGNHFTRALTKEMKLTFAKAEHLKCNATKSPDPRAVFQALRPVFNDYVAEIQRSIGFFSSVNRSAKIGRLIGVGNGFRLAGLQKFLQQNLQYEVERVDTFQGLAGDHVLNAPLFQDNLLTFCVPYGLALQTLKLTDIHTTLLPPEIAIARKVRRKKPWAVATAATLLAGLATSAAGYGGVWHSVSKERFGEQETAATNIESEATKLKGNYTTEVTKNGSLRTAGQKLVAMLDTREYWLEVYKAVDECLPRDVGVQLDEDKIEKMNRISIRSMTCKKYDDLGTWFTDSRNMTENVKGYMREDKEPSSTPDYDVHDQTVPPKGPGYVFTLQCVHYHNDKDNASTGQGANYVRATLLRDLQSWIVRRQDSSGAVTETPVRLIGITHATLSDSSTPKFIPFWPNGRPNAGGPGRPGGFGPGGFGPGATAPGSFPTGSAPGAIGPGAIGPGAGNRPILVEGEQGPGQPINIPQTMFTLQFVWKPTPRAERKAPPSATAPAIAPSTIPGPVPGPAGAPGAAHATMPAPAAPPGTPLSAPPVNTPPVNTPPVTAPPGVPPNVPPGVAR